MGFPLRIGCLWQEEDEPEDDDIDDDPSARKRKRKTQDDESGSVIDVRVCADNSSVLLVASLCSCSERN